MMALLLALAIAVPGIEEVNLAQLQSRIHRGGDTTYVVNFWATWCRPCVEELPAFEMLARKYADQPVRVLLVSLDAPGERESKVEAFIRRKGYQHSRVVLLNEPKPHVWIDRVDPSWSGSIPATLFVRGERRLFGEFQFNEEMLDSTFRTFREGRQ
jgi:hypothetical protein